MYDNHSILRLHCTKSTSKFNLSDKQIIGQVHANFPHIFFHVKQKCFQLRFSGSSLYSPLSEQKHSGLNLHCIVKYVMFITLLGNKNVFKLEVSPQRKIIDVIYESLLYLKENTDKTVFKKIYGTVHH